MNIEGKKVVLTGATGGIGKAIASKLARAGASLVLVSRNEAQLEVVREGLPGTGHQVVAADVTTEEGRAAVLEAVAAGVDMLVNNAGINHFGLLQQQTEQQLRGMFEVNTLAPMMLTQALLPQLQERESAVVNIGSGFGSIGFAGYCGYSASKFGLRGFTEALRRELADTSVRVLYLAPRATATDMNPANVVALNEELGNATDAPELVATEFMTLLRKKASARYLGWPERFFVKLNSLFPSVVDGALSKQLPTIKKHALAGTGQGS